MTLLIVLMLDRGVMSYNSGVEFGLVQSVGVS